MQKWDYMLYFNENEMKMKNRSHRYNINRTWPRHGYKYTERKMYLSMMMVMCNKKYLSNTWTWIHEIVNQHWGWVEKKHCLYKKTYIWVAF